MKSIITVLVFVSLVLSITTVALGDDQEPFSIVAGPDLPNTSYGTAQPPRIHKDGVVEFAPCNPNRYKWFYFILKGVRQKRITFRWTHTQKANPVTVQYQSPRIFYTDRLDDDRIAYEVCDEAQIEHGDKQTVYTFEHTFKHDTARIAYSPIFTNKHASHLLAEIKASPFGVETQHLGKSHLFNMDLTAGVITDPAVARKDKRGVWWIAREDSYETGGSLALAGGTRFLLSDDPVAVALRRKIIFWVLPILSQDGVRMGHTNYPIDDKRYIYLTTQWGKPKAFPELGRVRKAMQDWKASGRDLLLFHRFHSASYWKSYFRRYPDTELPGTRRFYLTLLQKRYMPHYKQLKRRDMPSRASYYIHQLWPEALSSATHSDFVLFPEILDTEKAMHLNNDASYQDGELFMRALADYLKIPGADRAPPFLTGGAVTRNHARQGETVTYQAVYRDLRGKPPGKIQVVIDGQACNMKKTIGNNHARGVVYTYQTDLTGDVRGFHFVAANEIGQRRIPCRAEYPGPFIVEDE